MQFVAEWISLTEMKELQSACMFVSMKAREKECEEFLSYQDDQVWNELSEEWYQYLTEKKKAQPCDPRCVQQHDESSLRFRG